MVHPHRHLGEGGWSNVACHLKPSQTFTDAQLRASYRAVSPPGMATARLSRGWCGLHNASPGANYLHSRTPTASDVTGRPKRSSRTATTWATAYLPRYHPEGKVSTGASNCSTADTETLLPTYSLKIIGHFNNWITSHFNNATLIMFTYLALLISR
jgi:hypothetical protein